MENIPLEQINSVSAEYMDFNEFALSSDIDNLNNIPQKQLKRKEFKGFDKSVPLKNKLKYKIRNRLHTQEQIKRWLRRTSFEALYMSPLMESKELSN